MCPPARCLELRYGLVCYDEQLECFSTPLYTSPYQARLPILNHLTLNRVFDNTAIIGIDAYGPIYKIVIFVHHPDGLPTRRLPHQHGLVHFVLAGSGVEIFDLRLRSAVR